MPGVYKSNEEYQVYIDIADVDELISYQIENDHLVLGANMTLTEAMDLFDRISQENKNFIYLKKLKSHIDLIANVPVRNVST